MGKSVPERENEEREGERRATRACVRAYVDPRRGPRSVPNPKRQRLDVVVVYITTDAGRAHSSPPLQGKPQRTPRAIEPRERPC